MKKLMKTMTAAVLALAMTLSLAACGAASPTAQAEETVTGMFQAFKTLDLSALANYTGDEGFLSEENLGLDELPGGMDFMKKLLSRLDYQILGSEQADEGTVFVNTKISALDMKPILGQFMTKVMEYAFAHMFDDPGPSDEEVEAEMLKILTELLDNPDLEILETEVLIEVNKTENGWRVNAGETLADAVLGGLQGAIDEISESFS